MCIASDAVCRWQMMVEVKRGSVDVSNGGLHIVFGLYWGCCQQGDNMRRAGILGPDGACRVDDTGLVFCFLGVDCD